MENDPTVLNIANGLVEHIGVLRRRIRDWLSLAVYHKLQPEREPPPF